MASIFDTLTQSITPDVLGTLGKTVGLNTSQVQQGMGIVGPLLMGGLAKTSKSSSGLQSIMGMLGQSSGGIPVTGGGNPDLVSGFISSTFGDGASAVGKTVSDTLGFNVTPIISAAIPMVLGVIGKTAKDNNLDAKGVAKTIQTDTKAYMDQGGETANLVNNAMKAGDDAQALKGKFTPEEWARVRLGPVAAAGLVIAASPSGVAGVAEEVSAGAKAVEETRDSAPAVSIFSTAFSSPFTKDELSKYSKDTPKSAVLSILKESVAIVAEKSPADTNTYRDMLLTVGNRVAQASKEGGFMGFGGQQVTEAEASAIGEIRSAIGS